MKNKNPGKPKRKLFSRTTIGLLLENTVGRGAYQADLWSGVVAAVREQGVNLVCFAGGMLDNSHPSQMENIQNVVYDLAGINNVDGLIISGTLGTFIAKEKFRNFVKRFKAMPIVSTIVALPGIASVRVDNEKGMREMLRHLIQDHGYRKIGFIQGPEHHPDAIQRYQVYQDVLLEYGIPFDENLVVSGSFSASSGATALDQLIKKAEFDIVVAANDTMALGALEALQEWGISVPYELPVVGFDDINGAKYITPPLTTVYYPAYEQGKQAAEMLMALLSGKETSRQETLPTKLRLRESCGCPDPTVEQARAGLIAKSEIKTEMNLSTSQPKILADMQDKILSDLAVNIGNDHIKELLGAFYAEIQGEPTKKGFLAILDEILRMIVRMDENVSDWHTAISSMRHHILPLIHEDQVLFRAEDLWQQARVMIGKRSRRAEGYKRLQIEQNTGKLNKLAQELDTTSDLVELMNIFAKGLKRLAIPSCYLSLYENPAAPKNQLRLVLAYQDGQGPIQFGGEGQVFHPHQLIPQGVISDATKLYQLIVEPLYYRENQLGIIVFEFDSESYEGEVYETLRSQISSALWRVHLNQYLRALSEASANAMGLQEPDAILQNAVNQACKTVGALSTQIVLVNRNREIRGIIKGGKREKAVETANFIGEITIEAIETKKPILISNTYTSNQPEIQDVAKSGLGAMGCFPLSLRGKLIGAMWIYYEKPHHFPTAEVNALKIYVNQTTIAYDNAKRMKDMEHLQKASQKLANVADVRDVLYQIAESARDVLEADSVAIWSYDASRKTFLPDELVTDGIPEALVEKSKLHKPRPHGTAAAVMRNGYLVVTDVDHAKYKYLGQQAHGLRGDIGVKSFQGIVLKVGDEVLGVLYVNYKVVRGFDDEEEATLKVFAYYAALALKKARLLKRVRMVSETARVVAEVSAQENLESTLKAIVEGTLDAFGCDAVTLNAYNPVTKELGYPPALSGVKHSELVQRFTRGETISIVYEMLQQEEPYIVEDLSQNPNFKDRRFAKDEAIKSCVAIPLDAGNQKVGVMFVNYRTPHHFTGQEIEDIKLFAYQAALAIRNAQLYDDVTRRAQYLQSLYLAGTAVTSSLTLDEILNRIVEQASVLTARQGWEAIFCNLALKENSILTFKVSYSASQTVSMVGKGSIIDLEHDKKIGVVGRAVKTRKSQLVTDVTQDPDYIVGTDETKSLLAVPIIIGEDILGVIAIGHSSDGTFDEDDQAGLELLSTQAALAIRNAQLYGQATRKAQYLQALYEGGKTVTSTLTLDEILKHIVEQASLLTTHQGQQPIFCYLALKEDDELKFKASYTASHISNLIDQEFIINLERDKRIGIVGRAVKTGQSQLILDVTKDPDYIAFNKETRSLLAVPISIGKNVIGVIVVEHSSYDAFSEDDRNYLESLSTQAALAFRNAQLYGEAMRKARSLEALYEVGKAVTSTLSLDEILERIVEQVWLITGSNGEQAYLVHLGLLEDTQLKIKVWRSDDLQGPQDVPNIDLEQEEGIGMMGRAAKTGASILRKDVARDKDYLVYESRTRSELAVPIKLGKKVIGVINVEHPGYGAFDREDQQSLEALATHVAIAIQNAQAYENLKQTQGLVAGRTALAWMGMASNTWRHTIDKHARTIVEQVDLLRRDLSQIDQANSYYHQLDGRMAMIQRLARQIEEKPITPPLSSEEGVVSVEVNTLIRERIERLWESDPYKSVTLKLGLALNDDLTVRASPEWLRRAFDILINNAVDAIADSPRQQVTIETTRKNNQIEMLISDTGKGIPTEVHSQIFVDPIKKVKGAKGLGMGLLMAQVIIQTYGGEIGVDFTGPAGTIMYIKLPLEP